MEKTKCIENVEKQSNKLIFHMNVGVQLVAATAASIADSNANFKIIYIIK